MAWDVAAALLPPARATGGGSTYRIAVVCMGNICRSPMAAVVLTDHLERAGLDADVEVVSAGTGTWHVGEPMDRRAAALLTEHGYDATLHRAQQFEIGWFAEHDLVLAMDGDNYTAITGLAPEGDADRVRMFRDFDPAAHERDRDVPDPFYGADEGFASVLTMVERTAGTLVAALATVLTRGSAG